MSSISAMPNFNCYKIQQDELYAKLNDTPDAEKASIIEQSAEMTEGFITGSGHDYNDFRISFLGFTESMLPVPSRGPSEKGDTPEFIELAITVTDFMTESPCFTFKNSAGSITLTEKQIKQIRESNFFGFGPDLIEPINLVNIIRAATHNCFTTMTPPSTSPYISPYLKVRTVHPEYYNSVSHAQGYLMGLGYDTKKLAERAVTFLNIADKTVYEGDPVEDPNVNVAVRMTNCYLSSWSCQHCKEKFGGLPVYEISNRDGRKITLDERQLHDLTHGFVDAVDPVAFAEMAMASLPDTTPPVVV